MIALMSVFMRAAYAVVAFFRKPTIATPTEPTPLRTLYVNSAAAGGGDGTIGTPYNTITQAETAKQAGDLIYLRGTFDTTGSEYIGMDATLGTEANPIVYKAWPGFTATLKLGGGASEWNTIYMSKNASIYHWFVGLILQDQTGADSGRSVSLTNSHHAKFIGCTFDACSVNALGSTNFELWDCIFQGDHGSQSGNSGDILHIRDGSHNFRIMRCTWTSTSRAGHAAFTVYGQLTGNNTVEGGEIFDCEIQNEWAGGLQLLGGSTDTHVHWNRIHNVGTNPSVEFPPGSREVFELASHANLIEFNQMWDGGAAGLSCQTLYFGGRLEQFANNTVRFNTITLCGGPGLVVSAAQGVDAPTLIVNNLFENNIVWDNSQNGVGNNDGGTGYYEGFYYPVMLSMYQANSGNGGTPWADDNFYGNVFRNNVLGVHTDDTRLMLLVRNTGNKSYTAAQLTSGSAASVNNIVATDPLFVSSSDFRLQSGSPAIDAGYATSGVSYLGAGNDIGVFEYGGSD